jgi:hypothetical protein
VPFPDHIPETVAVVKIADFGWLDGDDIEVNGICCFFQPLFF